MNQVGEHTWPSTSPDLLLRIRDNGDASAWGSFGRQYVAVIRGFCTRRGLQQADAEDVVQQVLLAVSRQISAFEYEPERAKFRTWLGTLLIRAIWKARRKKQISREVLVDPQEDWPVVDPRGWAESFGEAVFDVALKEIRPEFSQEEWTAFERTWQDGESNTVVAESLQRPVGWVYQARFRILKQLRQHVEALAKDFATPPRRS